MTLENDYILYHGLLSGYKMQQQKPEMKREFPENILEVPVLAISKGAQKHIVRTCRTKTIR